MNTERYLVIVALLAYVAWLVKKLHRALAMLITKQAASTDGKVETSACNTAKLGYEWYEDGWPVLGENGVKTWMPYENPRPYECLDGYAEGLLGIELSCSVEGRQAKEFLKLIYETTDSYVPMSLADTGFKHVDPAVRAWIAAHLTLSIKDWSGDIRSKEDWHNLRNAPLLRDYVLTSQKDNNEIVQAALWSNLSYPSLPFGALGAAENGWQFSIGSMPHLHQLALMRNPRLSVTFVLELMQSDFTTLNMSEQEYAGLLAAALINPALINQSRRTGRGLWLSFEDVNPPDPGYSKMWELAAGKLLNVNPVPYRVFKYVQTTPEIKETVYKQLAGKQHKNLRAAILAGCEPSNDLEVLKLGLEEPDWRCRAIAVERCGSHIKAMRKSETRHTSK